jgi:uncharacterized protein (TIGR03435 family)
MNTNLGIALALIGLFLPALGSAQTRLEFEVASIRPSAPTEQAAGVHIDGSQVRYTRLSIRDYIATAYRMRVNQITGPDWLATETFNIVAKLPDGATPVQVPQMLQALLADRFKMRSHHEMKEFSVYALEVAKGGLKMNALPPDPEAEKEGIADVAAGGSGNGAVINLGRGRSFAILESGIEIKALTMAVLAEMMSRFMDRPVVDMTDAKGAYDFTLDVPQEDRIAMLIRAAVVAGVAMPPQTLRLMDGFSGQSLSNALEKVGLKLESRKLPLDVLVIDQIEKTPSEN